MTTLAINVSIKLYWKYIPYMGILLRNGDLVNIIKFLEQKITLQLVYIVYSHMLPSLKNIRKQIFGHITETEW